MGKNVAVFVDVANIFYAAKAAGVDIDYVTLLKAATAGRDFVRAYAYTGLDPENENQRNFHAFLARNQYKVVSKDIRKYGDGKVKANLDIELVVDMLKTARNLDVAIVVSGDGDFAPAIRAVQEMGVRVEVISFRGNTSSDLIEVADQFSDITQLARVDKGSSRSGRRVAGDEEDLSMTEVPDKQTEGTGQRGRGRGRTRSRSGEAEAAGTSSRRSGRSAAGAASRAAAAAPSGNGTLTVMPGEKLSRVAATPSAGPSGDGDEELTPFDVEAAEGVSEDVVEGEGEGEGARRRRRRRGGRGRGRGRGREGEAFVGEPAGEAAAAGEADEDDLEPEPAPRRPQSTPFGSVWDSQLGTPAARPSGGEPIEDEDFEEPEIPEYLIAEQRRGRQGQAGRGQGGRGGRRGAYNAAIERERYGRGGGGGGINRYPDVSGRGQARGGRQQGGYARQESGYGRGSAGGASRTERPSPRSGDPWSEVPPELEEVLRAQLAQSGKGAPRRAAEPAAGRIEEAAAAGDLETMTEDEAVVAESTTPETAAAKAPRRRTTTGRKTTAPEAAGAATATTEESAPKRRTTRRKAASDETTGTPAAPAADATDEATPATRARRTRKTAAASTVDAATAAGDPGSMTEAAEAESPAPKRRTMRKKAEPA